MRWSATWETTLSFTVTESVSHFSLAEKPGTLKIPNISEVYRFSNRTDFLHEHVLRTNRVGCIWVPGINFRNGNTRAYGEEFEGRNLQFNISVNTQKFRVIYQSPLTRVYPSEMQGQQRERSQVVFRHLEEFHIPVDKLAGMRKKERYPRRTLW